MMKKFFTVAMAITLAITFAACSSIKTGTNLHELKLTESDTLQPIAHINAEVWGVYLFGLLPLFTGSTATPGACAVFKDTVRVDNATSMLTKKAVDLEASRLLSISSHTSSAWFFLLITINSVQISGNAVK